jgi:hypothetical protein
VHSDKCNTSYATNLEHNENDLMKEIVLRYLLTCSSLIYVFSVCDLYVVFCCTCVIQYIFSIVGIGNGVDHSELEKIASDSAHAIAVADFNALATIKSELTFVACQSKHTLMFLILLRINNCSCITGINIFDVLVKFSFGSLENTTLIKAMTFSIDKSMKI